MRCLMLSLCIVLAVPARSLESQQKKLPGSSAATREKGHAKDAELAAAIAQVRGFAERAQRFENIQAKVEAMTHFADLLWRHDEDYARQLFLNALDSVKMAMTADREGFGSLGATPRLRPEQLIGIRSRILARLARHDSSAAKRLAKIDSDAEQTAMNLFTALELVRGGADTKTAVEFARQALSGPLVPRADLTVTFLNRLRRSDPQAADGLFQIVLARFTSLPELAANDLLMLGYYVFTYPGNQSSSDDSIRFVMVGPVGTVNIRGNRRAVSADMIRLYLEACANFLSRPIRERAKRQEYYVAAYQLREKASRFAPSLVPRFSAAMQATLSDVPSPLADEASYANLSPRNAAQSDKPYDLDAILSNIEKRPDSEARDVGYLDVAYSLYKRGEFERGRNVAERIGDLEVRRRTTQLMNFGIGARAIKAGDTLTAEEAARSLGRGIESSELWLAIAAARFKEGKGLQGAEAARTAIKLSSDLDAPQRSYIVLAAAGKLAEFDSVAGLSKLEESITHFNSVEEVDPQWSITLSIGKTTFDFPLQGLDSGNIAPAIEQLASSNREAVIAAILSLKRERILGRSLMILSSVILAKNQALD